MNSIISVSGTPIRQEQGLYSLNDLHKVSGGKDKHSPRRWLSNNQTTDLIKEIEIDGIPSILKKQRLGTFCCRELVIAYAAWISPAFNLKVIRGFLDTIQQQTALPMTLTPEQQFEIKEAVNRKHHASGATHQEIYRGLYHYFKIPKYQDILQNRFGEAMRFIEDMPVRGRVALPAPVITDKKYIDEVRQLKLIVGNLTKSTSIVLEQINLDLGWVNWQLVRIYNDFALCEQSLKNLQLPD